jgi:hypothetical protein
VRHVFTLLALVLALLAVGCGGDDEASTTTTTTTEPAESAEVRVYWLLEGKVWPARREVETEDGVASAALDALLEGPTDQEAITTAVPEDADDADVTLEDGVAAVEIEAELSEEARAQVVYTLTQFPTVDSVELDGRTYTRADFEDVTPAILVESPLPFEEVGSPLRVTGTANTFEATFEYELTDTDGRIVDENFVTATSGSGTRGTFDFTTDPYTVPFEGVGSLIVYESSAKDGSRINLVEIPLRMTP